MEITYRPGGSCGLSFEMWAEKYRPKKLSDIVDQKDIVERLKSFTKSRNVPHCIFAGRQALGRPPRLFAWQGTFTAMFIEST
jgi:hypothetical protein